MKKLCLLVVLVVLTLILAGCYANVEKDQEMLAKKTSMFVIVETPSGWNVVYDKETKVMYAVSWSSHNFGNFTMLVNSDGTPKLWKGDSE